MTKNLIPDLLDKLKSSQTYERNDAIKKIIKFEFYDDQVIAALKEVIENDTSISVRNFARAALDVFGVEHSAVEIPISEQEQVKAVIDQESLAQSQPLTSPKVNLITAIGIGLLVGFVGTAFIMNLMTFWTSFMASLANGAIGSVFGILGSVLGYALSGSKRVVWIGATTGAFIIPGCWLFAWIGTGGMF